MESHIVDWNNSDIDRLRRSLKEINMKHMVRSQIKSADIQANPEKIFDFVSNPLNWPQYAIVNTRSVTSGTEGWYRTVTKFGEGEIKVLPVRELGIFDHIWRDPQATWTVPARVVPNGDGAMVMMTLFQPPLMSNTEFDCAMQEMDIEFNKLKEILERGE